MIVIPSEVEESSLVTRTSTRFLDRLGMTP